MARAKRDIRLNSRTAREGLKIRKKAYYCVLEKGKALGYYRGSHTGSWLARVNEDGKYREETLGAADDNQDANELDVLSFSGAQAAARKWFDDISRVEHGGHVGPYTVEQACDAYLADYQGRGGKDEVGTRGHLGRIKAALGKRQVQKLSASEVREWHRGVSNRGPLTRSVAIDPRTGARTERYVDRKDRDAVRRRLATANRALTVLKAVLNHAFQHQPKGVTISSKAAWEAVKPHREADAPKVRYLTDEESVRLINASASDFRDLVGAALLTGARYGELCRLRVRDFDEVANAIRIEVSKSGKPRSVALTNEGTGLFARLAKGKAASDLLLVREDGSAWAASHQLRRMAAACGAAQIVPPVSFHILRHTYGSRLAMRGAPMPVIAAQLGHADTRMTERHYAHLGPSYVSEVVRGLFGLVGIPAIAENVVAIRGPRRAV
jgi:integrase